MQQALTDYLPTVNYYPFKCKKIGLSG